MTRAHKRNLFIAYLFLFIFNIIIIFFYKSFLCKVKFTKKNYKEIKGFNIFTCNNLVKQKVVND